MTIINIGVRAEDNSGRPDFERDHIHCPGRLRDGPGPFPLPVEAHGARRFVYRAHQLTEFPTGMQAGIQANNVTFMGKSG